MGSRLQACAAQLLVSSTSDRWIVIRGTLYGRDGDKMRHVCRWDEMVRGAASFPTGDRVCRGQKSTVWRPAISIEIVVRKCLRVQLYFNTIE